MCLQEAEQSQRKNLKIAPVSRACTGSPHAPSPELRPTPHGYLTTRPGQVQIMAEEALPPERAPARYLKPIQGPGRKEGEKAGTDTWGQGAPLPLPFSTDLPQAQAPAVSSRQTLEKNHLCPGLRHGSQGLQLPWTYLYRWPTDGGRGS